MKRIFALLITISMVFSLASLGVSATTPSEPQLLETVTDEQGVTYTLSQDGTYYIVSGFEHVLNGATLVTDIEVAQQFSSIPVTTIAMGCFSESLITTIKLPAGLTTIEAYAFLSCEQLKEIVIPSNVTFVGMGAFYMCKSLESASLPKAASSIGNRVFGGCVALNSLTVEEGNETYYSENNCIVETADQRLIAGCKDAQIPSGVKIIGYAAFSNMENWKTVTLPDSVVEIEADAFWSCKQLQTINIPKNVAVIENPFGGCGALTSINVAADNKNFKFENGCLIDINAKSLVSGFVQSVIPNDGSVEIVGYKAFSGLRDLSEITLSDSVKVVSESAFFMCDNLKTVQLGEGVEKIEDLAFESCIGLETITIPASVNTMGDSVFEGCTKLNKIVCGATQQPAGWCETWKGNCKAQVVWATPVDPEPPVVDPSNPSDPSDDPSDDPSNDPSDDPSEDPSDDPSNPDDPSQGGDEPDAPSTDKGDINGNGSIDSMDYVFLKRAYFGTYKLSDIAIGDINGNGSIDSMDYVFLKRAYFGTYAIK